MASCRSCREDFEPTPRQIEACQYICKPCYNAYQKEWRKRRKAEGRPIRQNQMSREWRIAYMKEYKERPGVHERDAERMRERQKDPMEQVKTKVRRRTRSAVESGELVRQPCEVCGDVVVDAHHDDYDKPLEVRWLCRQHHSDVHQKVER